jgi:PAS domain S-box-containing protein
VSPSGHELDREIAMLRERLEGAEDMRRAIAAEELDGFVVGEDDDAPRVVLLESALRAEHARGGALPLVTVSRAGTILHANQLFAALVGRPLRELYRKLIADLVTDDSRAGVRSFLDPPVPDSSIEVKFSRDGRAPVATRLVALDVGHGAAAFLAVEVEPEDVQSIAEHALEAIRRGEIDGIVVGGENVLLVNEADRSYREIVDRMDQGAVGITRQGDVLYVNEPFARMLGTDRSSLLGSSLFERLDGGSQKLRAFLDEPTSGKAYFEVSLRGADDARIPAGVSIEPAAGDAPLTLVLTDLTERRRHRKIEEETRRKDEFLAVLAHELRNPLASIRTCVEVLSLSTGLEEKERYSAEIIGRQTDTLVRLVDDLLDIHRLNEGKIVIRRQPVRLDEVVGNAIEAANPYVTQRRLKLDVTRPDVPVIVDGDKVRLTQVLLNLLTNAAKFTPQAGTVSVIIESAVGADGPRARVTVTDTGRGIEADLLEKIFDPYVQVGGAIDGAAGGLGLGLSVARRLMHLHGGSIHAESDGSGHGSRFVLELPVCTATVEETEPAFAHPPLRHEERKLRVLVADDTRDAADSLAMLLNMSGHEARTVYDGAQALAVGREFRPDVVFLDIGMPVMDGYAAAQRIRAEEWGRAVTLYALTGYGHDNDRLKRSVDVGFDRHFVKPIDPDVVSQVLEQALAHRARKDRAEVGPLPDTAAAAHGSRETGSLSGAP